MSTCTRLVTGRKAVILPQNMPKPPIGGEIAKPKRNCNFLKIFLESHGQNLFRTVEKSWISRTIWSQRSSKNFEKRPHFALFLRPGDIDPYTVIMICFFFDWYLTVLFSSIVQTNSRCRHQSPVSVVQQFADVRQLISPMINTVNGGWFAELTVTRLLISWGN